MSYIRHSPVVRVLDGWCEVDVIVCGSIGFFLNRNILNTLLSKTFSLNCYYCLFLKFALFYITLPVSVLLLKYKSHCKIEKNPTHFPFIYFFLCKSFSVCVLIY